MGLDAAGQVFPVGHLVRDLHNDLGPGDLREAIGKVHMPGPAQHGQDRQLRGFRRGKDLRFRLPGVALVQGRDVPVGRHQILFFGHGAPQGLGQFHVGFVHGVGLVLHKGEVDIDKGPGDPELFKIFRQVSAVGLAPFMARDPVEVGHELGEPPVPEALLGQGFGKGRGMVEIFRVEFRPQGVVPGRMEDVAAALPVQGFKGGHPVHIFQGEEDHVGLVQKFLTVFRCQPFDKGQGGVGGGDLVGVVAGIEQHRGPGHAQPGNGDPTGFLEDLHRINGTALEGSGDFMDPDGVVGVQSGQVGEGGLGPQDLIPGHGRRGDRSGNLFQETQVRIMFGQTVCREKDGLAQIRTLNGDTCGIPGQGFGADFRGRCPHRSGQIRRDRRKGGPGLVRHRRDDRNNLPQLKAVGKTMGPAELAVEIQKIKVDVLVELFHGRYLLVHETQRLGGFFNGHLHEDLPEKGRMIQDPALVEHLCHGPVQPGNEFRLEHRPETIPIRGNPFFNQHVPGRGQADARTSRGDLLKVRNKAQPVSGHVNPGEAGRREIVGHQHLSLAVHAPHGIDGIQVFVQGQGHPIRCQIKALGQDLGHGEELLEPAMGKLQIPGGVRGGASAKGGVADFNGLQTRRGLGKTIQDTTETGLGRIVHPNFRGIAQYFGLPGQIIGQGPAHRLGLAQPDLARQGTAARGQFGKGGADVGLLRGRGGGKFNGRGG